MNGQAWIEPEINLLKQIYSQAEISVLSSLLPLRTPNAIRKRANKLGLQADIKAHRKHLRIWTDNEIELLKKLYYKTSNKFILFKQIHKSQHAIYKKAKQLGLNVNDHRHYKVNDYIFSKWNEITAYWVGFIAADGCLKDDGKTIVIELSQRDKNHLVKLRNIINPEIVFYETAHKVCLRINSPLIWKFLNDMGITPRKSLSLKFPDNIPFNYLHHFVRGYSDGDGSVYWHGKTIGWNLLGTYEFLDKISALLPEKINICRNTSHNLCKLQTTGKKAIKILNWLYQDANIFLERKQTKCQNFL